MTSRYDVAVLLLKHGANPNVKTKYDERTPLHYAADEGRLAVVATLLKHGAYIDARDVYGMTPLYLAVRNTHVDVVYYLLRKGADPNVQDGKWRMTPLHVAAYFGEVVVVKLLLRYGANPNAKDGEGKTPLHYAIEERNIDVAKVLLRHGADPTIKDVTGLAPLDLGIKI
jgi:FOG: Ankyrin repeat